MPWAKKIVNYTDAELDLIAAMQRAGYSWLKIAEAFGYKSKTTMMKHTKDNPKLKELVMKGIEGSIADVANSLYKKAMGYDYVEEVHTYDKVSDTMILTKTTKKHVPADTFAMNSFLNNRAKELWKPRRDEIEKKAPDVIVVSIGGADVKQLRVGKKQNIKDADFVVLQDEDAKD